MSADLQSALVALVYILIGLAGSLNVLVIFKIVGLGRNDNIKVTIAGAIANKLSGESTTKLKGEMDTGAGDNPYTVRAATEHVKAAEANRQAQETALKVAETNERTEALRLERTRLETPGANA